MKLENTYIDLPDLFYTVVSPTPVSEPQLVKLNRTLAKELGLNIEELESVESINILAGNSVLEGIKPIAQAYAGHQFGHFTKLGDGRAILLGEWVTGDRNRVDIQLKGSGPTPYSRRGDGRAALGPMLREYIISEAMHALGIPTTRSLAVVATGEWVRRQAQEKGAILVRVAKSHLRVGTFQYAAAWGSKDDLEALTEYAIHRHYPTQETVENKALYLLEQVARQQADTVAKWQLVGFIHGVMNTDNMSISGETIDYGPCAFMDIYDLKTVFSSIDQEGRYAYGNQPRMAMWNLARFAESLLPIIHTDEKEAIKLAEEKLRVFDKFYKRYWLEGMRSKLGLFHEQEEDPTLIKDLLEMMEKEKADYTNTFVALTYGELEAIPFCQTEVFLEWHKRWKVRQAQQNETQEEACDLMQRSNPVVIPRNHRVEEAIEQAVNEGNEQVMEQLLEVLSNPYRYEERQKAYMTLPAPSSCPYKTFCGT